MPNARDVLTPDSLAMLQVIAETGSFAAAARQLQLVPSALTYRVRQMEEALDVLLFDRSARQAHATAAGQALLQEGTRLLADLDAVAHRIQRVASGWEPELSIVADGLIAQDTLLDLVQAFYALQAPTRIKLGMGTLTGPLESLATGRADLVLGLTAALNTPDIEQQPLGSVPFVFAVAPFHPLARAENPISDTVLKEHRLIVVADSGYKERTSIGLLDGQDTFTVDSLHTKIAAQIRGLGCGFLPQAMITPYVQTGQLVIKPVARPARQLQLHYAWKKPPHGSGGKALQWWLSQLQRPVTQQALLTQHRAPDTHNLPSL